MLRGFLLLPLLMLACAPTVTRDQAIATAYRYTQVEWLPDERHVLHGPDSQGIQVRTPDESLAKTGDRRGWWRPGVPAKGMPYQWGGFDTPESFLEKIAAGKKAGDISTPAKRLLDDDGTSVDACGIDCSGFVSRCWGLPRPYSTRELPEICDRLDSWDQLKSGDILLNDKHVLMFERWTVPESRLVAYEAGPYPVWRVSRTAMNKTKLLNEGYVPWRYRKISEKRGNAVNFIRKIKPQGSGMNADS